MDKEADDEKPQSLISLADIVCAVALAVVMWGGVGLIAMLMAMIWMCG